MVLKFRLYIILYGVIILFYLKYILDIYYFCDNYSIFMKLLNKDKVLVVLKVKTMINYNDQFFLGVGLV